MTTSTLIANWRRTAFVFAVAFLVVGQFAYAETRDPLKWPYAATSIWNMPIGSGAVYAAAHIPANPWYSYSGPSASDAWVEYPGQAEAIILMNPAASTLPVYHSDGSWSGDRCVSTGSTLFSIPWPSSLTIQSGQGDYPTAAILADGRTIKQFAATARCTGSSYITTFGGASSVSDLIWTHDIYGDGRAGSQGGSGLSGLGGKLRIDELTTSAPRHALSLNISEQFMSACNNTPSGCGRWPAFYGETNGYGENNPNPPAGGQMLMGSLLAIPPSVDCNGTALGLETQPGKWLCWTLQNYGAYIVDTNPSGNIGFHAEKNGTTDFYTAFKAKWGYKFSGSVFSRTSDAYGLGPNPFLRDMAKIVPALSYISNNSASSIGGGGTPRQPLAPPFMNDTRPMPPPIVNIQ